MHLICIFLYCLCLISNLQIHAQENLEIFSECYVPKEGLIILRDSYTNETLQPDSYVEILTSVKYICPKGTFLTGMFDTNLCDGNWINPHPECIKMCSPIKGITINTLCTYKEIGVSCEKDVKPGTVAKINCAVMYQKPQHRQFHDDLHCQEDGNWNYSPFECEPVCGTVDTNIPFSVKSKITEVHKVPWNVAIYSMNDKGRYEQICGGTLVETKIVISAAHCFWDSVKSRLHDSSKFVIAVGKFYRDYYVNNETEAIQMSNISRIDIPIQFAGADYDYVSDMAVLTLSDHIVYKNHIRPACLAWKIFNQKFIESNLLGVVAGWGITDGGTYSTELRSIKLSTVDGSACKNKITKNDKISGDKFCVETAEGKNVCQGDSGGGFLIPQEINGIIHYYLWGIVSNGINHKNDEIPACDADFITTFTNIQFYEFFVRQSISEISFVTPSGNNNTGCYIPKGGNFILIDMLTNTKLTPGTYARLSTSVKYVCPENTFSNKKYNTNFCDEEWIRPHPKCKKKCPPIKESSVSALCIYKETEGVTYFPCDTYVKPGTTAKIKCANMYQKLSDPHFHEDLICKDNGDWNEIIIKCESILTTTVPTTTTTARATITAKTTAITKKPVITKLTTKNPKRRRNFREHPITKHPHKTAPYTAINDSNLPTKVNIPPPKEDSLGTALHKRSHINGHRKKGWHHRDLHHKGVHKNWHHKNFPKKDCHNSYKH